jgi:hypothetical protein
MYCPLNSHPREKLRAGTFRAKETRSRSIVKLSGERRRRRDMNRQKSADCGRLGVGVGHVAAFLSDTVRHRKRCAVLVFQHLVGLAIADEAISRRIEMQLSF